MKQSMLFEPSHLQPLLQLGSELKVSEVLMVRTDSIGVLESSGSVPITVTPHMNAGTSRKHTTMLRPFAVREVMIWVRERKEIKLPEGLLFPKSAKDGAPIDKSTLYLTVKATFKRAGFKKDRSGGRTLRNSFAAREIKNGPIEMVGQFMGHRTLKATELYNKIAHPQTTTTVSKDKVT